ncbi:MAG: phosphoribosylamine--glycine ligase [Synergistaceae bacterium]|nr:phosphoribosylamine--glycine ligase [Synergistaceae bacterium]
MAEKSNFLVLGSGAREHSLVRSLSLSARVGELYCAPGNPGMRAQAHLLPLPSMTAEFVLPLIQEHSISMVVIGPEAPLAAGLADDLRKEGVAVFGPGKAGAILEGSKTFAKKFMERHGIPTAFWDLCTTFQEAEDALKKRTPPYVVKANGLAAGKGVFVTLSLEEAKDAAKNLLEGDLLGEAGRRILVEDALTGEELTILALTDGKTFRLLSPSQDHKRIFDGDQGPNTGGMGAYSPVPLADAALLEKIRRTILDPTFEGLRKEAIPYCGVLYAGLMVDDEGIPRVIEYNVRLGDPEAQVVLPLLEGDFGEICIACAEGRLDEIEWKEPTRWAADVVLASGGYPGPFEKGKIVSGLEEAERTENFLLFHGGTSISPEGKICTAGGRVFSAVGIGDTLEEALDRAYTGASLISFDSMHYRRDIGQKALKRKRRKTT